MYEIEIKIYELIDEQQNMDLSPVELNQQHHDLIMRNIDNEHTIYKLLDEQNNLEKKYSRTLRKLKKLRGL